MTEKNKELIQRMRSIAQASMGPDAVRVPPGIQALIDGADALEAALAQQPQGEAVAWILEWSDGVKSVTIQDPKEVYNAPPKTITPLYAAPAPASSAPDGQFLRDIILECAPVVGLKADEASAEEVLHLLRRKAEASASPAALTDAKTLALGAMVDAMRWWGAQEDGIPAECKKAFDSAMLALGWSYSHPQDLKVLAASPADQGNNNG